MRFDDDSYIEAFYQRGEYPKIHNDIFHISHNLRDEIVLDLGSCTGLLSKRLSTRNKAVVGIEANANSFAKSVLGDNIIYYNLKVNDATLPRVKEILILHGVQTVYARRVFPELYDTGGLALVKKVCALFAEVGIQHIVIEGRQKTPNATNLLSNVDAECAIFSEHYRVIKTYKNCRILKLRE